MNMWTSFIGCMSDVDIAGYIATQEEIPSQTCRLGRARCGVPVWDGVLVVITSIDLGIRKCRGRVG